MGIADIGPLAGSPLGAVSSAAAEGSESSSAGDGEGKGGAAAEIRGALASVAPALIGPRLLGVGIASAAHRENLVGAMIHGRKCVGK